MTPARRNEVVLLVCLAAALALYMFGCAFVIVFGMPRGC